MVSTYFKKIKARFSSRYDSSETLVDQGEDRQSQSQTTIDTKEIVTNYEKKRKSSIQMAIFNLANNVIGMGVIWLPLCTQISGVAVGLSLIFFAFLMSSLTGYLIAVCSMRNKVTTYQSLAGDVLGQIAYIVTCVCRMLLPFSMCVAYARLVSNTLAGVFDHYKILTSFLGEPIYMMMISLFLVVMPFAMLKHVSFLEHISFFSILFVIFYTTVFVIVLFYYPSRILLLPDTWAMAKPGFFQAFATFALAYTTHHNVLLLYNSLHNNTVERFTCVIFVSFGFAFVIFLIIVIAGFVSFSGVIFGDILSNYCMDSMLMLITRIIFCVSLLTTLPLQAISVRSSLFELIKERFPDSRRNRIFITLTLFIAIYTVALLPLPIKTIIEITGALTTSPLVVILPCLMYLKVEQGVFFKRNIKTVVLWMLIVIGVVLVIFGTTMAIRDCVLAGEDFKFPRYWCDGDNEFIENKSG
ncbi:putative sodium-coupled neutral amino acid transporter 11 [Thelohanellus kitauei]|uniref:Putative sodium-coupled neutral amino acid transporter 11 n=1 Tax=Thelohanellus kitauei TaxID=669202 RepID=A0A0C2NHF5_THEKT|nr:putative sodium-coupled neutral amino acid transporter 11 [Thelohanellus kitauei]